MPDQDTTETKAPKPAPKRKPVPKAKAKTPAPKPKAEAEKPAPKKDGDPSADVIGGNAKAQLRQIKEAILNLEEEKAEVAAEIKERYAEAKSMGFDTKILRKVISTAKRDPKEVEEERALFDLYADAAGIYAKLED